MNYPKINIGQPTFRLIPSRFPPVQTFDAVASPDDLEAVMELEGWTNDRLVLERLNRLPREQWVYGAPNSSIVMASFMHVGERGTRFNGPELGAWYASFNLKTAIAEVSHHLRREAAFTGRRQMRLQYRSYTSILSGSYVDIRGLKASRPDLYHPTQYDASQAFGESLRKIGEAGITFDSVRFIGGENVVGFLPKNITTVTMGSHFEITAPLSGRVVARRLS